MEIKYKNSPFGFYPPLWLGAGPALGSPVTFRGGRTWWQSPRYMGWCLVYGCWKGASGTHSAMMPEHRDGPLCPAGHSSGAAPGSVALLTSDLSQMHGLTAGWAHFPGLRWPSCMGEGLKWGPFSLMSIVYGGRWPPELFTVNLNFTGVASAHSWIVQRDGLWDSKHLLPFPFLCPTSSFRGAGMDEFSFAM